MNKLNHYILYSNLKLIILVIFTIGVFQYSINYFTQVSKQLIICDQKVDETHLSYLKSIKTDSLHNRLGDNFVRDFYRYECKSIKRYGSIYPDPAYRLDGDFK